MRMCQPISKFYGQTNLKTSVPVKHLEYPTRDKTTQGVPTWQRVVTVVTSCTMKMAGLLSTKKSQSIFLVVAKDTVTSGIAQS